MPEPQEVDYTAVLVFPGFGAERESAETVVGMALDWLNTCKDEPGFRFARPVSAHLEMVQDADEARARLEADEDVAIVLMHDIPDDERDALVQLCHERHIGACYTVDAPRPSDQRSGPLRVVFRSKPSDKPPAHTLAAGTLTDPLREDGETGERIGDLIAVLALGVMEHHWRKNSPLNRFRGPIFPPEQG
jgi:hypothetical protein